MTTEAFVYDAVRTPRGRGRVTGALHGVKPVSLVVGLVDELRRRQAAHDFDSAAERVSQVYA
jgi:acetyl-CoA C-acetyltransferase